MGQCVKWQNVKSRQYCAMQFSSSALQTRTVAHATIQSDSFTSAAFQNTISLPTVRPVAEGGKLLRIQIKENPNK